MDQPSLFAEILKLNETAAHAGQFEVAYHLLAAALHAAELAGDKDHVETVIRLAASQASAVDEIPDHPIASNNARSRGNTPLYESLQVTARALQARIESQRALNDLRKIDP